MNADAGKSDHPNPGTGRLGTVCRTVPGHARVMLDPRSGDAPHEVDAVLPRRVRVPDDEGCPVAVGDRVGVEETPEGPVVGWVERRTTALFRRASGRRPARQIICANADTMVCVMASAQPEPRWGMLDRYLLISETCGMSPLVVLSKCDLATPESESASARYRALGYEVLGVCALRGRNMPELRSRLAGHSSVVVGKSGVGKSTLVNALVPGASQAVGEVGITTSKGRHTTTLAVLFQLDAATTLIDTPGVREIAPWNIDPATVSHHFSEMVPLLDGCRFAGSCTHSHETGCAVREAVDRGVVTRERYESFLRLREAAEADAAAR